jgi:ADP-heptose:LPS heptosyltransferase
MLGDGKRYFYEPEVFKNNPRMAQPGEPCVWVANYGGCRPYIKGSTPDKRFIFNDNFRPTPGEIFFSEDELKDLPSDPYIVIEPNVKNRFAHGINKAWIDEYWDIVAKENLPFLQLGTGERLRFPHYRTESFRRAMAVLSKARLYVGTDGGLHHAAAALGIPAVVIWTGFSSPKHLGYDSHTNIHDGSSPCGNYSGVCKHCREKAFNIKPDTVIEAIHEKYLRSMAT